MPADKSAFDEIEIGRKGGGGRIQDAGHRPRRSGGKSFAIMRTSKIKNMGSMRASLDHTFRERETLNADPHKLDDNSVLIGADNAQGVIDAWHDQAPEKIRKNAVHGIEYLVTGSPEAMQAMNREEQDAYFADAVSWLEEKHGRENILSAVVHRDETTPHLTAMIIPKVDGKLNAKHFLGGREKLRAMQTDFAENVAADHGLERGVMNSKATHQRVSQHYTAIQKGAEDEISLPERHKGNFLGAGAEKDEAWLKRASEEVSEHVWQHRMVAQQAQDAAEIAAREAQAEKMNAEHLLEAVEARNAEIASLKEALSKSREATQQQVNQNAFLKASAERAGVSDDLDAAGKAIRQDRAARIRAEAQKIDAERLDELRGTAQELGAQVLNGKRPRLRDSASEKKFLRDLNDRLGPQEVRGMVNGHEDTLEPITEAPGMQRAIAHAFFTLSKKHPGQAADLNLDRQTVRRGLDQFKDIGPDRSHGIDL